MNTKAFRFSPGLLVLMLAYGMMSCTSVLYVAPKQVDCSGMEEKQCYLLRKQETGNWVSHSEQIVGFDYEPGFSYKIKVKSERIKHPVLGASEKKYTVITVLEKKEMTDDVAVEDLLGKEWNLIYLVSNNTQIIIENQVPILEFNGDGKVNGFGGCNNFNSDFTLHGRTINIGDIAATKMMCQEDMDLENAFFQTLGKEVRALFSDGKLILTGDGGNQMIFRLK